MDEISMKPALYRMPQAIANHGDGNSIRCYSTYTGVAGFQAF
jgi:hypothetical protein